MKHDELRECGILYSSPLAAIRAKAYWKFAAAVIAVEIIGAIALVCSPMAQKFLIDGVNAKSREQTFCGVIAVAALLGVTLLCQAGSYLLRYRLGVEARCRIKSALFHSLLGMPEGFLKERGSGYFFNRLQVDSTEVVSFFAGSAMLQFSDLLKFAFALAMAAYLNWKCTLFLLPFLFFQYFLYRAYRRKQYRLGHKIQECTASERNRMQEYLAGHTTIKTHDAAKQATEKIDQGLSRWRGLAFQKLFHENRFRFLLLVPFYVCEGGVALYGLGQVLASRWSLGELWALVALMRQVFSPVQRLAVARFQMQQIQAAWDRLRQICHASVQEDDAAEAPCSLSGDIKFSGVDFAYFADQPILRNLNLTVPANSLLFLTGSNGSGKSTILQLLLRLYEPSAGSISFGGRDIRSLPVAACRSRIGYLGQTPEFFSGTIRSNLLLNETRSDEEIFEVLRLLNVDTLVNQRGGLDGTVTERAQNFSGGERLRLALAREFLRDTDILLLDEPAANLDDASRREFYSLVQKIHTRRTVIAVVHDVMEPSGDYTIFTLKKTQRTDLQANDFRKNS